MNRRDFTKSCLGTLAAASIAGVAALPSTVLAAPTTLPKDKSNNSAPDGKLHIAFLLFEGMTALDFLGPATILTISDNFVVDYVWRDKNPVYSENGKHNPLGFLPTATFADISKTDILCVPGTSNPYVQIEQADMMEWVASVGKNATWVTSVCTGSLLLGAAGLLKGYKATAHWAMLEDLAYFGAIPVAERVVHDRNRVTGAGVTSGIDFALTLLTLLCDENTAKAAQLSTEYDPHPPYNSGSPKTAAPELLAQAKQRFAAKLAKEAPFAQKSLEDAARRLGVVVK